MILKHIIFILLIFVNDVGNAQSNTSGTRSLELKKADVIWIEKILDNWEFVCRNELKVSFDTPPWIIFYDSSAAFHLNAHESLLPKFTKTSHYVFFAGRKYQLIKIPHSKQVWVPDRKPILFASFPTVTMPYSNNKNAFFIAPLPSFFHKLSTPDQEIYLDFLFLGNNIYELTHTRQLMFALPQLIELQKSYKLPESIDDNTIENKFGKMKSIKNFFLRKKLICGMLYSLTIRTVAFMK